MIIYSIIGLIVFFIVMLMEYVERDYHCDYKEIFWEAFFIAFIWPITLAISLYFLVQYIFGRWENLG